MKLIKTNRPIPPPSGSMYMVTTEAYVYPIIRHGKPHYTLGRRCGLIARIKLTNSGSRSASAYAKVSKLK